MCQLKTEQGRILKIHKTLKPGTWVETALPFFKISAVKKIPGGKMSKHKYNLMYPFINTFVQRLTVHKHRKIFKLLIKS